MVIEVRGAGFINKGAELMLRAIVNRLSAAFPDATLAMAPTRIDGTQPFRKLVAAGFYPKASVYWRNLQLGHLASMAPRRLRELYGVILDREVDVVLDASGFAYSDQWGVSPTRILAHSTSRWKRQGTKVILLPQAFGPFGSARIRGHISRAIGNVDLVMPREQTSLGHLTDVVGEQDHIRQYPDFTNLVEGVVPVWFDPQLHRICIVPNYRMVDKVEGGTSDSYISFMRGCVQHLLQAGERPFILVHEGERDRWLADRISTSVGGIPVISVDDPLEIKGILGAAHATIGSRFHGLVSALSQGVPSLATGWSHKYRELITDYGVPDAMIAVDDPEHETRYRIDAVVETSSNARIRQQLLTRAAELKRMSEAMWNEVMAVMDHADRRRSR